MITEKNILEVTNTQFDKYAFQTSEGVTVITEHDFDYLVEELVKKLTIPVVSVSFEEGYEKGWREATTEACKEIVKNYQPNER